MKFSARLENSEGKHAVVLRRGDAQQSIPIALRSSGFGSSVSGGEALSLALATCYCNDIYREAEKRGIKVDSVEVEVDSDFESEGAPAKGIVYRAKVTGQASEDHIRDLMKHTDTVAEIQNTIRAGMPVVLEAVDAISRK